jgi:phosphoribosylformylglycinamidine synthase
LKERSDRSIQKDWTLSYNDLDKFECRWVYLKAEKVKNESNCIWTKNLPGVISLPVVHGEGKFIPNDKKLLDSLNKNNQIVFKYSAKDGSQPQYPLAPNGSME